LSPKGPIAGGVKRHMENAVGRQDVVARKNGPRAGGNQKWGEGTKNCGEGKKRRVIGKKGGGGGVTNKRRYQPKHKNQRKLGKGERDGRKGGGKI